MSDSNPERLTQEMLTIACEHQQILFGETFPSGIMEVTRENLITAATAGLSINWGARQFLTVSTLTRYTTANQEARRVYLTAYDESVKAHRKAPTTDAIGIYMRKKNEAYQAYNLSLASILADVLGLP